MRLRRLVGDREHRVGAVERQLSERHGETGFRVRSGVGEDRRVESFGQGPEPAEHRPDHVVEGGPAAREVRVLPLESEELPQVAEVGPVQVVEGASPVEGAVVDVGKTQVRPYVVRLRSDVHRVPPRSVLEDHG